MFKIFLIVLLCVFGSYSALSSAQTIDDQHSDALTTRYLGSLQNLDSSMIQISGKQYNISPGFVVYDSKGSFVPRQSWPTTWTNIRFQLDVYQLMHRIWLLEE